MEELVAAIFEVLGIPIPEQQEEENVVPVIGLEGGITVYCDVQANYLDLISPVGPLPESAEALGKALSIGYRGEVVFCASLDENLLLAYVRMHPHYDLERVLVSLDTLADTVAAYREQYEIDASATEFSAENSEGNDQDSPSSEQLMLQML